MTDTHPTQPPSVVGVLQVSGAWTLWMAQLQGLVANWQVPL